VSEAVTEANGKRLRILVGTVEVGATIPDFADGFRQLGHQVTTAMRRSYRTFSDVRCDVDVSPARLAPAWPKAIAGSTNWAVRLPRGAVNRMSIMAGLARLILRHDLFLFQWGGESLTMGNVEYPLLRKLGKRIVTTFMGSDVRHMAVYRQQYDQRVSSEGFEKELLKRTGGDPNVQMRNLRMAEEYADVLLSQPNQSGFAVRPYRHLFLPMRIVDFKCEIPGRQVPVVVHAPSATSTKGTAAILIALEELRAAGVQFELRVLRGTPNQQVLQMLSSADVAIDQLYFPLHGKFTLEAMASGCAVATCNRQDYEPYPSARPIWHIDAGNVREQLGRLLTDRQLRLSLAQQGREYVTRNHDHVKVARQILGYLNGDAGDHLHYPSFYARCYRAPASEPVPPYLQKMTASLMRRWGLPHDVDPDALVERGLISAVDAQSLREVLRWPASVTRRAPDGAVVAEELLTV